MGDEEADDNDLNNPFISIPDLLSILLVLMKFKSKKAPSAPTKDIGNGRTKDMAKPMPTYMPIHFNWYIRNCLSLPSAAPLISVKYHLGYIYAEWLLN